MLDVRERIGEIFEKYPYGEDFFVSVGIDIGSRVNLPLKNLIDDLSFDEIEACGIPSTEVVEAFKDFVTKMEELRVESDYIVREVTILGGYDKSGNKENIQISIKSGDIISIVGPTGSGKSRLLGDIECMAQGDTPTGRRILINGSEAEKDKRFSLEYKLVAQLSQNMNFVMDLSVKEFLSLHAESRMVEDIDGVCKEIIDCGNDLTGESFTGETLLTQLSGGQSRALMIADTALLSSSPIVLIDEIENAGVDRKKAIDILISKDKIVFISTHDPILALMGNKRLIIKNGGISKIIETRDEERKSMDILQDIDMKLLSIRDLIRRGEVIDFNMEKYFS